MVRKLAWDVQGPESILSTGKNKNVNQTELGGMRLYSALGRLKQKVPGSQGY